MRDQTLFSSLPDQARLWIYASDRTLQKDEIHQIRLLFDEFIADWHSHGRKVSAEFDILHNRFVLLAANIPDADISGCGIDASVHALEQIAHRAGFSILSGLHILYKSGAGTIESAPRPVFRQLVRTESITGETIVFDTSLTHVHQLRAGSFELPAQSSWHATVFRIPNIPPVSYSASQRNLHD